MRFLICGLGSIGHRHLRNLQAIDQDDIVLLRTGKSTLPEDELAGLPVERDLDTALEHWHPDAVIVSNPTSLHLDVATPAAESGCHLLLEKPISHSLEGIDEFLQAVKHGGSKVLIGFQFRFHPGLRAVKRLLEDDVIGQPISAHVHWGEYLPDWHPWEDYKVGYSARKDLGGGVVHTLSHPFDYLRWLLGEVSTVTAEFGTMGNLDIEVEDTAKIVLTFEQGPLACVNLDYNRRPASHWLEIIGTKGTILWDNEDGAARWWSSEKGSWQQIDIPQDFERNVLFLEEIRHFIEVVSGDLLPLCTIEDGIRALEIALAAHQSATSGTRIHILDR